MAVESSFTSGGTTVVRFVLVPSSIAGKMAWILPLTSSYLEIAIQISHTITFKEFVSSSILFVFDFVLFYDMSGLSVEANFHKPYRNLSLFSYLELLWTGTVIKCKKMSYNFFLFLSVVNFINRNLTFWLFIWNTSFLLSSFTPILRHGNLFENCAPAHLWSYIPHIICEYTENFGPIVLPFVMLLLLSS